jgi:hypothetical protein
MRKNAMKCNKTQSKWCINKHGASKIIDRFETYQYLADTPDVSANFSGLSIGRPTDLFVFSGVGGGTSPIVHLPAVSAAAIAGPAIMTSTDSAGRVLRPTQI